MSDIRLYAISPQGRQRLHVGTVDSALEYARSFNIGRRPEYKITRIVSEHRMGFPV